MEIDMIDSEYENSSIQMLESPLPEIISLVFEGIEDRVSSEFTESDEMDIFPSYMSWLRFLLFTSTFPPLVYESGETFILDLLRYILSLHLFHIALLPHILLIIIILRFLCPLWLKMLLYHLWVTTLLFIHYPNLEFEFHLQLPLYPRLCTTFRVCLVHQYQQSKESTYDSRFGIPGSYDPMFVLRGQVFWPESLVWRLCIRFLFL